MKITRSCVGVVAGLALAGLGLASAAPAFAAGPALSAGSNLYGVGAYGDVFDQLYTINSTNAVATAIGTGGDPVDNEGDYAETGGMTFNPFDGYLYYIDWSERSDDEVYSEGLRKMDPATGVSTEVFPDFTWGGEETGADSIAVGPDGTVYVISDDVSQIDDVDDPEGLNNSSELFSVDLTTGELTYILDVTSSDDAGVYGFVYSGIESLFLAIDDDGRFYAIDTETETVLEGNEATLPGEGSIYVTGLAWDAAEGRLWFLNYDGEVESLWSLDVESVDVTAESSGDLVADEAGETSVVYSNALALIPGSPAPAPQPEPEPEPIEPALAETGVNDAATTALAGSAAFALLAGAGALIATRARRKARA